ncbi:hypothetical protein AYM40_23065 [Paraburkholderia phytofirmans OLGA172]|uniref:Cyclic nucleotide-binding domain-containing protein n=1 Tax=Paraburkholderia phytofirmans OLGA172 TaxID=1417228 RepID=A0A160FQS6_9BURK|nr:mechanosensitive ion channel family protein [Paraburkholderia phytofirmans]ANB75279.1 hypothetical protein AYM40_23065 [Paraburkholderia phytofirmans OLGA172]
MQHPLNQLLLPIAAAVVNLLVFLWKMGPRRPVVYAAIKSAAFALFTVTMLTYGVVPTQAAQHIALPAMRFVSGVLEVVWWLLSAAAVSSVVRAYYAVGLSLRQHRFTLDVIATLLYAGAAMAITTDVLDIPLKGVLATSGALAIVLGLALQSTLSDLFSGLLINATSPYRVGDAVTLDDSTEGEVVEITWRATHIAKTNRDTIVVPNSVIAKSRIINRSVPAGAHATVAKFDAFTKFRPSDVVRALELAIDTCVGIANHPTPTIATTLVGRRTTRYEITFFPTGQRSSIEVLNRFYDAAHRHMESFSALIEPFDTAVGGGESALTYRLIEGIGVFGTLSRMQRVQLAAALVRRELTPGHVILAAGEMSRAITIIAHGIVGATSQRGDADDIVRFGPREYFGESGPIAGVTSYVSFVARTYVIAYELPRGVVASLLKQHSDVAHALAARLAARERKGQALMHPVHEAEFSRNGLIDWIYHRIKSMHHSQA